jgi:predicted RecA/RadA family phage recombinase
MKNYIQPGMNITLPAPEAVISGQGVIVGNIFGIASGDAAINEDVDIVTEGVFELPKVGANNFALGAKVYFDDATNLVTTTASGNTYIGVAIEAAIASTATVRVRLNGSF